MKNKLNILFITARSDMGGGSKHLFDLCSYFKEHNPEIGIFIAAPEEFPFGPQYQELSQDFFPLKARSFSLLKFIKLWHFCKQHNISIIHSHGRGAGIYSRLLKLSAFTIIHTFHGVHLQKSLGSYLKYSIDRILGLLTDHFICVSNDEKTKAFNLKLCQESNTSVIPNGIVLYPIQKIPCKQFTIGTLSRFDHQKGLDLELEGIAYFKKIHPELSFKLLIAGDGEEFSKIHQLRKELSLQNEVELLGQTNNPQTFLNKLDLYLSHSRGEGLPLAVLEAMGAEVPCLLSNVQGHKELGENGCAMLFDLNSSEDFANKLLLFINCSKERIKIAQQGKHQVLSNYTLENMAKNTFKLYQTVVPASAAPAPKHK